MNYGADQSGENFAADRSRSYFFIPNNTANVALDRIESKRALDLREDIERYSIIVNSIENAMQDLKEQEKEFVKLRYFEMLPIHQIKERLGYSEEKSVYRIRKHVLDKLLISCHNLLSL
jgi:DNA-directed RNA polymerase specialized sigma subunit